MTPEQKRELRMSLKALLKQMTPRLPDNFHESELREVIDRYWHALNYGDLSRKLGALVSLTCLMTRCVISGLDRGDPLLPTYVRAMDLQCQFGLAERREIDMNSADGEMVRQKLRTKRVRR